MRAHGVKVGGRTVFPVACVLSMHFLAGTTQEGHTTHDELSPREP